MVVASPRAWVNGRVYTGRRFVEAALALEGRIERVGSTAQVRRAAPTGTEVVDLAGDWLLPGLVDAHCHLAAAIVAQHAPRLEGAGSLAELRGRVLDAAHAHPARTTIVARGWDEAQLAERRRPTRDDLDRWPLDGPVVLLRSCHHVAAVNSAAIERLGWNDESPDPPGGRLGRSNGRLDGLLYESAVGALRPLFAEALEGLRAEVGPFLESLSAVGLTTIAPMGAEPEEIDTVRGAVGGPLPVRLRVYLRHVATRAPPRPDASRDSFVRTVGVKLYVDGSLGARTAWLSEPYADAPGERGFGALTGAALEAAIQVATASGWPVALHAIGDRAVAEALQALRSVPTVGTARIEHASMTPPHLLEELARARPVLVVQPHFVPSDTWLEERVGAERARWSYAFASLRGAGVTLAGSSDAPIEPFDPWTGIRAASARRHWAPSERLDPVAAFRLYTDGASAALAEPEVGSLEPGAFADAVRVAGRSWSGVVAAGASGIRATYLAGAPVYERTAPAQRR